MLVPGAQRHERGLSHPSDTRLRNHGPVGSLRPMGNFKPSPDTEAAIRDVMIAAGVTPPKVVTGRTGSQRDDLSRRHRHHRHCHASGRNVVRIVREVPESSSPSSVGAVSVRVPDVRPPV